MADKQKPDDHDPHAALEEILRTAALRKTTGYKILRIDFNQGGVRAVRIGGEEDYRPN